MRPRSAVLQDLDERSDRNNRNPKETDIMNKPDNLKLHPTIYCLKKTLHEYYPLLNKYKESIWLHVSHSRTPCHILFHAAQIISTFYSFSFIVSIVLIHMPLTVSLIHLLGATDNVSRYCIVCQHNKFIFIMVTLRLTAGKDRNTSACIRSHTARSLGKS